MPKKKNILAEHKKILNIIKKHNKIILLMINLK